ncbi:hypothetical protein [Desulfogranum marinum]|uniref:hypothetical protein n=1 Tax=Desulfogranum marinum TaxID=453220 RepID=UPI0019646A8D|nr:hypothetical protein [Desulfogranum marinum]MBM9513000.1 hypothetical protein [Desulfogranum marinum]
MRKILKKIIPEWLWPWFRWIDKYLINLMYGFFVLKLLPARKRLNTFRIIEQSLPIFPTNIVFDSSPAADITNSLDKYNIAYKSGRHSAYLSGHKALAQINQALTGRYPEPFGLKIIKSRQLSPDGSPYYTSELLAPASTNWSMRAIGSVFEKSIVSNLLHEEGVAPRVYDIITLKSVDNVVYFALVVQHIEGPVVHGSEGTTFIKGFKNVLKQKGLATVSIAEHCDLRAPLFRDNIVRDNNRTYYVDIQNFILSDLNKISELEHAIQARYHGDLLSDLFLSTKALTRTGESLFARFGSTLATMIEKSGFSVERSVVLDSCYGVGTALSCLLSHGLYWGYVIRPETDCSLLKSWLYISGASRFDCCTAAQYLTDNINKAHRFASCSIGLICDGSMAQFIENTAGLLHYDFVVIIHQNKIASGGQSILQSLGYGVAVEERFFIGAANLAIAVYIKIHADK